MLLQKFSPLINVLDMLILEIELKITVSRDLEQEISFPLENKLVMLYVKKLQKYLS